mgnify:CR=1 FL=1
MIYLFEDRKDRMHQYLSKAVTSDNLKEVIFDCPYDMDVNEYINNTFGDARVILFHSSYKLANSSISKEIVKEAFIKRKVPFIFFSGGLENNYFEVGGVTQAYVNSGDMYKNMDKFIEKVDETGEVAIPILLYGLNYLINDILKSQKLIARYFSNKKSDYVLNSDDKFILSRKVIDVSLKSNALSAYKNDFINWLLDSNNIITVADVQRKNNDILINFQ